MTPTVKRSAHVLFTIPYLTNIPLGVFSLKKNNVRSLRDLNAKYVTVNDEYTAENYISAFGKTIIKRFPCPSESLLDIKTGKSHAYINSIPALKYYEKKLGGGGYSIFPIPSSNESFALAISKKYSYLFFQIQTILLSMKSDYTLKRLKQKWGLHAY